MVKAKRAAPEDSEKRIGVRLPKEVRKALEALADEDSRDLSGYVRWVLTRHVKEAGGGSRKRGA